MDATRHKVAVIGLWHLGMVYASGLAEYGHKVIGVDSNPKVIENLRNGKPHVFEPGLEELIKADMAKGTLTFTTNYSEGVKDSDFVIIAADTQLDDNDNLDLTASMEAIRGAIPHLKEGCLVIISSQVPIGTCDKITMMIKEQRPNLKFGIACMPENLRLGQALSLFRKPDMLVIGTNTKADLRRARELYGFVPKSRVKGVNIRTAEMVKHAINAFLANQISYSNELGNLCDSLGVSWEELGELLHMEPRIGKKALLKSGLAFSGGTLARDVNVLRGLGKENGVNTVFLHAIMDVNKNQNQVFIGKIEQMFGSLQGLKVGVLGLTYKPGTSTIRRSVPIEIIQDLVKRGVSVKAYDPQAEPLGKVGESFERVSDAAAVADGANALLILTAWPKFKEIDFVQLKPSMKHHVIMDPLNMLDAEKLAKDGFVCIGIGKGQKITKI